MPYYKWTGIDIEGTTKTGKLFAVSLRQLEQHLFEQEIALLQGEPTHSWFKESWPKSYTIDFFKQLSFLLESGVYLTQALATLAQTTKNLEQRHIITYIESQIKSGAQLSVVLQEFPDIFDELVITTLRCGEETGTLVNALRILAQHYDVMHGFYKRLRSAAYMPIITVSFFLVIFFVVVVVVIPKLSTLFVQAHQDLPLLTRSMLVLSRALMSRTALVLMSSMLGAAVLIYRRLDKKSLKYTIDKYVLEIPIVGSLLYQSSAVAFLQTLQVLLKGGISLGHALPLVTKTIGNKYVRSEIEERYDKILQGYALSTVLESLPKLFNAEIVTLVKVGESSGQLEKTLGQAAQSYQADVHDKLEKMVVLFQPTVLIILGSMIGLLIFAVYIPLFEVSSVVATF